MVHCGALHICYGRLVGHCGALWYSAETLTKGCGPSRCVVYVVEGLQSVRVPCSVLQCVAVHCGNVAEGLQTIAVHCGVVCML